MYGKTFNTLLWMQEVLQRCYRYEWIKCVSFMAVPSTAADTGCSSWCRQSSCRARCRERRPILWNEKSQDLPHTIVLQHDKRTHARDLRFPGQRRFIEWSCGLRNSAVSYVITRASQRHIEYQNTRCHNPADHNLNTKCKLPFIA